MLNPTEQTRLLQMESSFSSEFGSAAKIAVRAPGRVNLIGEHTDYNDGFVMPAAIERSVLMLAAPSNTGRIQVHALNYNQSSTFSIEGVQPTGDSRERWSNYLRAMVWVLQGEGISVPGLNMVVQGDVPLGSGLSSSAAMLVAAGLLLSEAAQSPLSPVQLALLAQKAEREFVGVNVGIMDQYISALGKQAHALLIDTRSLEYEAISLPVSGVSLIIADTSKRRGLVDSEYNTRRSECERAVEILSQHLPQIKALRDVSVEQFLSLQQHLPEPVRSRAKHVITENQRTLDMAEALKLGDMQRCGKLMNESHQSLQIDYAVSCRELDAMTEAARSLQGVYGSRMTGAGFGGCTVSLVADEALENFQRELPRIYQQHTGLEAALLVSKAAPGAERIL